mmetsp:Transcript_9576/g.26950  ORF Transcript_9576/g.26950 Transcript_9576/m.26950 type:complete len:100 (+) Transcript_9576:1-300(+)
MQKEVFKTEEEQEREKRTQLPLPEPSEVGGFTFNIAGIGGGGGKALLDADAKFKAEKYQKMKERVKNAKTDAERQKLMRVMKDQALIDSINSDEGWKLK